MTKTKSHRGLNWKLIKKNRWLYLMFLLPAVYFIIFKYGAMAWLVIAFKDFNAFKGMWASDWVGLKWFNKFLNDPYFWQIFKNTIVLNLWMLVFSFPAPIILALIINELRPKWFKKFTQTVSYLPYFLSTVVVCSFILNITASDGFLNQIITRFGGETVSFMTEPSMFRPIYVISAIWQDCGWGSIIYLASLAGVDTQLYEAASIDGASRFQQIIHVSIPGILPVISIQLMLTVGRMLSVGYEKIILLYNGSIYSTADVISTYVYRQGLLGANYSYGAAVSLFQAVIALVLVVAANQISRKLSDTSLW